jgi:hypothetical protein
MKRKTLSFNQLIEKNKQEIMKDKFLMEKIEKRIDKKSEYIISTKK